MTARSFRTALEDIGRPIESYENILDFGCGCGRVLRHWIDVKGPTYFGTDYNSAGPAWGRKNLRHVNFAQNRLEPPLPYDAGTFDLVYGVSVFTHFPARLQRPWMEEMHRVMRPGGTLLLTLSAEGDFTRLTESERERFASGDLVEIDTRYAGTNMCSAYHPEGYVRRVWGDLFKVRKRYKEGALGSPRQDLYVFERLE